MKVELNINGLDIISDDLLEDLRGGTSAVISEEQEQPKEGNLYQEKLLDIWRSPKWNRFRGGTKLADIPTCRVCKNNSKCGLKNCRLKAVYEGKSFYSNVSYCKSDSI